jgi:hypothetical protein
MDLYKKELDAIANDVCSCIEEFDARLGDVYISAKIRDYDAFVQALSLYIYKTSYSSDKGWIH